MSKLVRRVIGLVLVLTLVAAQILIPMPMTTKVNATEAWNYSGNYSAANDIQAGVTLHCWNWSFENIEKNMALIASLGYTAIQTSPIQLGKQATKGYPAADWWVLYQPAGFNIDDTGNSALGTKAQFKKMCETAHQYGIYVIVDVVANHMANSSSNNLSSAVIADLRNDPSCWHDYSRNISNYYDRYNITQYCLDGVPDLNTGSSKVQGYVLNYLKECIDAGADGFRFDAVKHIETPEDTWCASNFWPTVINGAKSYAYSARGLDLYCYGELLYHGDEAGSLPDSAYTKYMNVTDNSWSNTVRNSVIGSGNAGAFSSGYHKNANPNQLVLWAESHDNYAGDGTRGVSAYNINKTWALVTARADAMSLYLARPENTYPQLMGVASVTGWSYPEVAAVNHFHNYFHGQGEYVANQNGIAYVERGNSGVVLVNCGGGSTYANVSAHTMANGTYTDQVTGNTFTVSGGKIKGQIGDTGIAVVYNAKTCDHAKHDTSGSCTSCMKFVPHTYKNGKCTVCGKAEPGTRVVYFDNSTKNWSNIYAYTWDDYGTSYTGEWPGTKLTKVSGETSVYSVEISEEATKIIFTNNDGVQTADQSLTSSYDMFNGSIWSVYTPTTSGSGSDSGSVGSGSGTSSTTTRTVYYNNTNTKWSNVYIYCWSGTSTQHTGAWPGVKMTKVSGESYIYSYDVPANAEKVIFHNGTGTQSADLTLSSSKNMYNNYTKAWSTYTPSGSGSDSGSGSGTSTSTTRTLYYNNNVTNWSNLYIYAWSGTNTEHTGSWPGKVMKAVSGENGIFSYELPAGVEKVIFHNGKGTQTADLSVPAVSTGKDMYNSATASWKTFTASNATTSGSITLYADNSVKGWNKVYVYAWTGDTQYCGAWPGVQIYLAPGESSIYSYELTTQAANVIFNNGSGAQTSNLIVPDITSGYNMYDLNQKCWTGYTTASAAYGLRDYTTAANGTSHSFNETVIAPTCDSSGYTAHTCKNCYYQYNDTFVEAQAHSYTYTESTGSTTHTCVLCGDSYTSASTHFTLAGANMVLGGTLDMNFFIDKNDISGSDYYAKIIHHSESGDVQTVVKFADWEDRGSYYAVRKSGLAARQMADKIDVTIYKNNGTQISGKWTDSVRSYAMRILEKQDAKTKTMLVDMLNYGAAAQTYFTYNTDDLANNLLSKTQKAYATKSANCSNKRVSGTNYAGSTLTLKSNIELTMYFNNLSTSMYAIVTFTNHYGVEQQIRVEGSEFVQYSGSTYGVVVDDVVVADGDQLVTVSVYNSRGTRVAYASDSVNSYAVRMAGSSALFEEVMKFTTSAYAYFH